MNRKQFILKAAAELFAVRGFEATPTIEVARAAGVSEGTIFHHFKTKDGVLVEIFQEMMSLYLTGVEAESAGAGSGLESIERMIRFHFRFINEYSRESLVLYRDMPSHFRKPDSPHREFIVNHVSRVIELYREGIKRGQSDGSIRNLPVENTALIIRGFLIGLTRQRLFGTFAVPDLTEEAIDFCRRSLAPCN